MRSKTKTLVLAAVVAATTIFVQGMPQAVAETDSFAYNAFAGGTRVTAVGMTVSSDLVAESSARGMRPASTSNEAASARVGNLVKLGAVNTDASGVASGIGFKTTAHARTANVVLLNGAIKVSAVDTTSKAESNGTDVPSGSSSTEFLGLTISGKKYPINVPANTGVTIPGVAQVVLNASQTFVRDDSVINQGAGVVVTLLKARSGAAAGATIIVNPTVNLITPASDGSGGRSLGGGGIGAYAFAHVGDTIEAKTGKLGVKMMPSMGTGGEVAANNTAKVDVPGVLKTNVIESSVTGTSIPALSESTVTSKLVDLKLFPTVTGARALISATAIGSTAHVRLDGETPVTEGNLQFVNLKIDGQAIPVDVPPNTTIDVAGLGKVVINEQQAVRVPGAAHGYRVMALHITLDTARAGLPIGAEIQIGNAVAIVYG